MERDYAGRPRLIMVPDHRQPEEPPYAFLSGDGAYRVRLVTHIYKLIRDGKVVLITEQREHEVVLRYETSHLQCMPIEDAGEIIF